MKYEEVKMLLKLLTAFQRNCSVGGADPKKFWIINKGEEKALKETLSLVADCV
jgi:hypothetical protein